MTKEKKPLFETMQFGDVKYAQTILDECEKKLARNKIGIWVSILGPIIGIFITLLLAYVFHIETIGITFWLIATIISYWVAGCLWSTLKMGIKVIYYSWLLIPLFPIDIFIAMIVFGFVIFGMGLFPIIFVLLARYQIKKDRDAAAQFLDCYRPAGV